MQLFLILALVLWGGSALAFTCDDSANTCTYKVTITEPTKTTGGTSLTNYKQTNVKVQLNQGNWGTTFKPATSPSGGGTVTQDYTFATAPCTITTLNIKASGVNTANVEGSDSVPTTVTRDRTLDPLCAPQPPGVTVN